MVKRVFFLTNRFFHLYRFDHLSKLGIEFVAILTQKMFENSKQYLSYFKEVYVLEPQATGLTCRLDLQETEKIILQSVQNNQEIRIICNDDVTMQIAGILRDRLSIPGAGEGICLRFSNKLFSKMALRGSEIKVPKFEKFLPLRWSTAPDKYFESLIDLYGIPLVIKPTDCASSLGFRLISTLQDFKVLSPIESQDYEIEEFLYGRMLHCDSLVQNGKVIFSACSAYNQPMGNFLQGVPIGSIILPDEDEIVKKLKAFSEIVLHQLGHKNGASHLEAFENNGEITFLEIAMRCPGGLAIDAYEAVYGINILENDFLIQIGLEPKLPSNQKKNAFWMLYPCYGGRVIKRREPNISCNYRVNWNCKENQVLIDSKSLADISASVIGSADTFQEAMRCFQDLEKSTLIEMK